MTLIELKARFGELAIEKLKGEDFMRRIMAEQQEVLNQILKAEAEEYTKSPDPKAKKSAKVEPVND